MLDTRIAQMLQDIRLQNNATATAIHCRGGSLENIDLPANRPQRRGGKQSSQRTTDDQGLWNIRTFHYPSPCRVVIPTPTGFQLRYASAG
jgi:hypothetical protein